MCGPASAGCAGHHAPDVAERAQQVHDVEEDDSRLAGLDECGAPERKLEGEIALDTVLQAVVVFDRQHLPDGHIVRRVLRIATNGDEAPVDAQLSRHLRPMLWLFFVSNASWIHHGIPLRIRPQKCICVPVAGYVMLDIRGSWTTVPCVKNSRLMARSSWRKEATVSANPSPNAPCATFYRSSMSCPSLRGMMVPEALLAPNGLDRFARTLRPD